MDYKVSVFELQLNHVLPKYIIIADLALQTVYFLLQLMDDLVFWSLKVLIFLKELKSNILKLALRCSCFK
jgi:hypothetical protein